MNLGLFLVKVAAAPDSFTPAGFESGSSGVSDVFKTQPGRTDDTGYEQLQQSQPYEAGRAAATAPPPPPAAPLPSSAAAPAGTGGSLSWRNRNPGNLRWAPWEARYGGTQGQGGFASFPDEAAGRRAQEALLRGKSYRNLSMRDAIARYAPAGDRNDPNAYTAFIAKQTGLSPDMRMGDLSPQQMSSFLDAQKQQEGWVPGKPAGR